MKRTRNYYNGIHLAPALSRRDMDRLRGYFKENECKLIDYNTRIGSASEQADVYKGNVGGIPFVYKISRSVNSDLKSEYNVTKTAFETCTGKFLEPVYFGECEDREGVMVEVLVTRLAIGDMHQLFDSNNMTGDDLLRYIGDVFSSIRCLAELRIAHRDLHLGNIFIIETVYGRRAVVGDFGKSEQARYVESSANDLKTFFTRLESKLRQLLREVAIDADAVVDKYEYEPYKQFHQIYLKIKRFRQQLRPLTREWENISGWNAADAVKIVDQMREVWKRA